MATACNVESKTEQLESASAGINKLREKPTDEQFISYGFILGLNAQLPKKQQDAS